MFYVEHFSFSTVGNKPDGWFSADEKNRCAGMAPEKTRIEPPGAGNVPVQAQGGHGTPQQA